MRTPDYPKWAPPELATWIDMNAIHLTPRHCAVFRRLATDARMKPVWEWYGTVQDTLGPHDEHDDLSVVSLASMVLHATLMPGKPGNLPPKEREKYLEEVRHHVECLIDLLSETRFDNHFEKGRRVDVNEKGVEQLIGESVTRLHYCARDEDIGILKAYYADSDGLYQRPYDYPYSHLTEILMYVLNWTNKEDRWDRRLTASSKPIKQTGEHARVIYFNCVLHESLSSYGVDIPFQMLATLANVALNLPPDQQADEDTVRKQVRRYMERDRTANTHGQRAGDMAR